MDEHLKSQINHYKDEIDIPVESEQIEIYKIKDYPLCWTKLKIFIICIFKFKNLIFLMFKITLSKTKIQEEIKPIVV